MKRRMLMVILALIAAMTAAIVAPVSATQGGFTPVTLCHATGSQSNPYVQITVDTQAALNGHLHHSGDIIPAPAGGCPQPQPTATPTHKPTKTNTPEPTATKTPKPNDCGEESFGNYDDCPTPTPKHCGDDDLFGKLVSWFSDNDSGCKSPTPTKTATATGTTPPTATETKTQPPATNTGTATPTTETPTPTPTGTKTKEPPTGTPPTIDPCSLEQGAPDYCHTGTPTPTPTGTVVVKPSPTATQPPACTSGLTFQAYYKGNTNVRYVAIAWSMDFKDQGQGEVQNITILGKVGKIVTIQPNGHQVAFLALDVQGGEADGFGYLSNTCTGYLSMNAYDENLNYLGKLNLRWDGSFVKGINKSTGFLDLGNMP